MSCCRNCHQAVERGHIQCIKDFHYSAYGTDKEIYSSIISRRHLICLQALHQSGCARPTGEQAEDVPSSPWSRWICIDAATDGYLDGLKYAHQNGCARPIGEQAEDVPSSP